MLSDCSSLSRPGYMFYSIWSISFPPGGGIYIWVIVINFIFIRFEVFVPIFMVAINICFVYCLHNFVLYRFIKSHISRGYVLPWNYNFHLMDNNTISLQMMGVWGRWSGFEKVFELKHYSVAHNNIENRLIHTTHQMPLKFSVYWFIYFILLFYVFFLVLFFSWPHTYSSIFLPKSFWLCVMMQLHIKYNK